MIDRTQVFDLLSNINGEAYRVKIFTPRQAAPRGGFPVLYVLDGNLLFATFAEAMNNESNAREIDAAVIVGVESGPGSKGAHRTLDFTSTDLTDEEKRMVVDLGPNPPFGGYENFLRVLQKEIMPQVQQFAPVDQSKTSIFGWSLGGLFVVHTLMIHPDAFQGYVALSPSLWRSNRIVFSEIPGFEATIDKSHLRPRLFLGVGSLEEELSPGMRLWKVDQSKLTEEMQYGRMVENAKDFSDRIGTFLNRNKLRFSFQIFNGETHNTAPWSAVNPVLKFLYSSTIETENRPAGL